jgi:hypothetical protein
MGDDAHKDLLRRVSRVLWMPEHSPRQVVDGSLNLDDSHPDWPFFRTRKETPSKYEAYVDALPGVWTKVRIEVRDSRARLYVHDQEQPTLIVNDLKMGSHA